MVTLRVPGPLSEYPVRLAGMWTSLRIIHFGLEASTGRSTLEEVAGKTHVYQLAIPDQLGYPKSAHRQGLVLFIENGEPERTGSAYLARCETETQRQFAFPSRLATKTGSSYYVICSIDHDRISWGLV